MTRYGYVCVWAKVLVCVIVCRVCLYIYAFYVCAVIPVSVEVYLHTYCIMDLCVYVCARMLLSERHRVVVCVCVCVSTFIPVCLSMCAYHLTPVFMNLCVCAYTYLVMCVFSWACIFMRTSFSVYRWVRTFYPVTSTKGCLRVSDLHRPKTKTRTRRVLIYLLFKTITICFFSI